jgi:diguanylate cyclase (GGDEF)-like protein/PAS domain S-box-containing protein
MVRKSADLKHGLYRAVFVNAAFPMFILDLTTRCFLEANAAADKAYGYAGMEWRSVSFFDLYEPEARASLEAHLSRLVVDEVIEVKLAKHLRRDGSEIWVEAGLSLSDGPAARHAVLCVRDVTHQPDPRPNLPQIREQLAFAEDATGLGHCVFNLRLGRQYWSGQQYKNLGREPDSIPGNVDALVQRLHPYDSERANAAIQKCINEGVAFDADWRVVWPDSTEHVIHAQGTRTTGADNLPHTFVCTTVDVTEKRRIEANLRQVRNTLSRSQQIAKIGTWTVDFETASADPSSVETLKMFGFEKGPVSLKEINERVHPDDLPAVEAARSTCIANPGTGYYVQYRIIPRPGELRYVESQAEVQTDASGKVIRMVGYLRDITDAKLAEQEIQRLAYHDETTGLANRVALRRTLDLAMSIEADACDPLALMVIDLSRFHDIFLTLGHSNADVLLRDVAIRIGIALGERSYLAHTGNAQFTAVLSHTDAYEFKPCADSVQTAFEEPFQVAGIKYDLNVHVGIALFPEHASDSTALMRMASVAVYQAKEMGLKMLVYAPKADPFKPGRLALLGEFRNAIRDGQIELYCQPKVDLLTGNVTGAESLVRWRHPRLGMISPSYFVPLVENTELIHVLTRYVLRASVRQYFNWQQDGIHVPLAVNLSTRNLLSRDLVPSLESLLYNWGGSPEWLGLEITESSLIADPDASIAELDTLSRMGFRMYIDDFGTGYSSLSYLMKMPVDVIKVDQGFTMNMLHDKGAAAIVKSTIELAHNLGMTVVAEGVASKEIWNELIQFGCDEGQGFYVSEPFPASGFVGWLKTTGRRVTPIHK